MLLHYQKRSTEKSVPNTCHMLPFKKIFFLNLTDAFFQISLKYIKLVISRTAFILVLCNFNFQLKITWLCWTTFNHIQQLYKSMYVPWYLEKIEKSSQFIKKVTNKLSIITGQYHCYQFVEKHLKEQSSSLYTNMMRKKNYY